MNDATKALLDTIARILGDTEIARKFVVLVYQTGFQDGQIKAINAQLAHYESKPDPDGAVQS